MLYRRPLMSRHCRFRKRAEECHCALRTGMEEKLRSPNAGPQARLAAGATQERTL